MIPFRDLQTEYSIRHWTPENGLPDVSVFGVTQTTNGYLWLGTRVGVVRFDGLAFTTFERANTPVLPDNRILQVLADGRGCLWAATARGLVVRLPSGQWEAVTADGQPLAVGAAPMQPAGDGAVWVVGPGQRWWRCAGGRAPEPLSGEPFRADALTQAANGDLWWCAENQLVRQRASDGTRDRFPLAAIPRAHRTFAAFAAKPDGSLHVLLAASGVEKGFFYEVPNDGPRLLGTFPLANDASGVGLAADPDGGLWLHVQPRFSLRWRDRVGGAPGFPKTEDEDVAVAFHADREGTFWVGMRWSGLYQLRRRAVPPLAGGIQLPPDGARTVLALRDGRLAVGTDRGLARIVHPRTSTPPLNPLSGELPDPDPIPPRWDLPESSVRALAEDRDGRLWVGTGDGLFVERAGKFEAVSLPVLEEGEDGDRRASFKIRAVVASRSGDVWVVAPRLLSVQAAGEDGFRPVAVLAHDALAASIAEDSRGRIWVATEGNGVAVLEVPSGGVAGNDSNFWARLPRDLCVSADPGAAHFFSPPPVWLGATNGLSSDHAWDVWEDRTGGIWVACENGLNFLSPSSRGDRSVARSTFQFTRTHGFPDLRINSLIEDESGHLWFGTDRGVFRIQREALMAVADGRAERVDAVSCGSAEAAGSIETNGRISRPGVTRTEDGVLWFAATRGPLSFTSRTTSSSDRPPLVAVEEVRVDGETLFTSLPSEPTGGPVASIHTTRMDPTASGVTGPATVVLPPGRGRVMEFRFTGLSFVDPEGVIFRYRLRGYEDAWHEVGTRRVAYYTSLPPGEYRFEVLAATATRTWAESPVGFAFRLTPFYWQTVWFRGAVILVGVAAVTAVAAGRIREIRRQEALARENALLRERASIARDIHDDLGPRLTQLALLTEDHVSSSASVAPSEGDLNDPSARRRLALLARDLANTLDGTLWTVEPTGDTLAGFADYLIDFATDFLQPSGIHLELALSDPVPPLPLSRTLKRHLSLFAKETLNNIVKHSGARHVVLRLEAAAAGFVLEIADDGCGLPTLAASEAEGRAGVAGPLGLISLRARAEAIGGRLEIRSTPNGGTVLRLEVPGPIGS